MNRIKAISILLVGSIAIGFILLVFLGDVQQGVEVSEISSLENELFAVGKAISSDGSELLIEIANDSASRRQGLSGRETLKPLDGLLLAWSESGFYGIWMPEMKFALDLVWIDPAGRVVAITEDVRPESYPEVFYPPVAVSYVLELESGRAGELGWGVGDRLVFEYLEDQ